jgi:hypothetical protein
LPAKGAINSLPAECCDGVKRRERARSGGWRSVTGQARPLGGDGFRALKMAEGRRAEPLWGRPPRRPSGRGPPGAGANQEDRRYQHLALAAGFSETGSGARWTLGAPCEETVNRLLMEMK